MSVLTQSDIEYRLSKGYVLQNTYEVLGCIGQGGMGTTYKARHIAMRHLVAIKVINSELTNDARALALFKREANLMRSLGQTEAASAIVSIETLLQDSSGGYYLVMEYIDGEPLSYYINKGARLRDDDLLIFADRMIAALDEIHAKGVVHRDISPENIMVPEERIVDAKILDFGVATDLMDTGVSILGDTFAGKISYASPEQLGLYGRNVTAKSDMYSLGLVLLSAAGIPPPGKGSMIDAIDARRQDILLKDTKLSKKVRDLIEGLLKSDPKERRTDFSGGTFLSRPHVESHQASNSGWSALMFGIVVFAVVAVGVGWVIYGQPSEDPMVTSVTPTAKLPTKISAPSPSVDGQDSGAPSDEEQVSPPKQVAPQAQLPYAPKDVGLLIVPEKYDDMAEPSSPDLPVKVDPQPEPEPQPTVKPESKQNIVAENQYNNAITMFETGGQNGMKRAMAVFRRLEQDVKNSRVIRGKAALKLAKMHDPKFYSSETSPLDKPDVEQAIHYYEQLVALGANRYQRQIDRLKN